MKFFKKDKSGKVIDVAIFQKKPKGWYECPDGVGIGFIYNNDGTFSAPDAILNDVLSVPKVSFLNWLIENNKVEDLNSYLSSDENIKLLWDSSSSLHLDSQLVSSISDAIGINDIGEIFNSI